MNIAEVGVIGVVALAVFGPKQLVMLIKHVRRLLAWLTQEKAKFMVHVEHYIQEQQLEDNTKKAEEVDAFYQKREDGRA